VTSLVRWFNPETRIVWFCLEGAEQTRIGILEEHLVDARDPREVVVDALEALRDELRGKPGERVLGAGERAKLLGSGA